MFIDHVTLAGPNLFELCRGLEEAGVRTEYGGVHNNGITHMSMASFGDGSYLELVAPVQADGRVALWHDFLLPTAGGAAWTIASEDVGEELTQMRALGVQAVGPLNIRREKPDGRVGAWELGYLGSQRPGATLPFLIHDHTDRSVRVPETSRLDPFLEGWGAIVLAVHDIEQATRLFEQAYGWERPSLEGGFFHFRSTAIYLSSQPDHLSKFGDSPSGCVLRCKRNWPVSSFRFSGRSQIAHMTVGWLALPWQHLRIGLEINK